MRLFGSDKIVKYMEKMGLEERPAGSWRASRTDAFCGDADYWWPWNPGAPYYVPRVGPELPFQKLREVLVANGVQSFCVLPLRTAQRQIGGLTFGSTMQDAYTAADIEFMQQVAHQVSVAVDNALNFEAAGPVASALARERDRLRALLEINNAVVSSVASKELFRSASASLRRVFGLDYTSLLLLDAESGDLRVAALDFPDSTGELQEDVLLLCLNLMS